MFIDCTAQGLFTAIRSREWICSHFCTEDIRSVQLSEQMCRYGLNDSSSPPRVTQVQIICKGGRCGRDQAASHLAPASLKPPSAWPQGSPCPSSARPGSLLLQIQGEQNRVSQQASFSSGSSFAAPAPLPADPPVFSPAQGIAISPHAHN